MCLEAVCASSLKKYLIKYFVHFLLNRSVFSYQICDLLILFSMLIWSLHEQLFLLWRKLIFYFISFSFAKKSLPNPLSHAYSFVFCLYRFSPHIYVFDLFSATFFKHGVSYFILALLIKLFFPVLFSVKTILSKL